MTTNYEKLRAKLEEMFMLDRADLDFGIYRIMNSKRDEILRFLDNDLLPQVRQVLQAAQGEIGAAGADELKQAEDKARALGVDPATVPKVQELRAKYAGGGDLNGLEQEVFNHLYSFFRRYYDEGDFLSLRRYKEGVYAIPYEGEEVKLHWANADQYYIKTAEHFRDYTFKVGGDRRVHFKLVDAQTEKDNNKASEKRVFILAEEYPVVEEDGELIIRFEYRAAPDKRKQKEHSEEAVARILAEAPGDWKHLLRTKSPTEKNPNRTVLEKHLSDYTARNTFDYFIHKNLGGFLRRELDFYIKNEVMHLDDIEHESCPKVEQYLAKVRAIRRVAGKLIDFLAQLEDFQKRLWLKKKFVVETHYLITLDRVPSAFLAEIASNEEQRKAWVELLAIDEIKGDLSTPAYSVPLSVDFLNANQGLVLMTQFFSKDFTRRLLAHFTDLDKAVSGELVSAENFQALRLLQRRYRNKLTSIYADPPYNSDAGPITYKNGYQHSSWLSLMASRIPASRRLLHEAGIMCLTIDDNEFHRLRSLCEVTLPGAEILGVAPIKNNPAGRTGTVGFSICHEYALFYGNTESAEVNRLEHSESQKARYKERDEIGNFEWTNFRKHGGLNTYRTARPRQFYPIYVREKEIRIPDMHWDNERRQWVVLSEPASDEEVLLPVDEQGRERIWDFVVDTAREQASHFSVRPDSAGKTAIYRKWRINDEGLLPQTWWDKTAYSAVEYGTNLLSRMFGKTHSFMFPKSLHAVADCLRVSGLRRDRSGTVLDYFAGSGTTGHAVLSLNRQDQGTRGFILVEMGAYFDDVLCARIIKASYSDDWRDGKPVTRSSQGLVARVIRLESYEDALANLVVSRRGEEQEGLLESSAEVREDYVLRYVLQAETEGSQSLLNVHAFSKPYGYTLNVSTDVVGETKEVNVDLVETFNWLLGLRVHTTDVIRGFHVVTGRLPGPGNSENGEKALIIWRDVDENPNEKLDEFFRRQAYNTLDQEFDVIYVNGDNNLQNLRKDDQSWKVRLIEEEFHRLMWDVEDV